MKARRPRPWSCLQADPRSTGVTCRDMALTEKGRKLLVRLRLEAAFGSEPMPSGLPHRLVARKEQR